MRENYILISEEICPPYASGVIFNFSINCVDTAKAIKLRALIEDFTGIHRSE